MSAKQINWVTLAAKIAAFLGVCTAIGWVYTTANGYSTLQTTVATHGSRLEKDDARISTLELENVTNSIVTNDRLNSLDRDVKEVIRRLNQMNPETDLGTNGHSYARD